MTASSQRKRRRWLRRILWGVGAVLVLALLAGAGLVWRLGRGPIRLDFLHASLEAAANDVIAPLRVELGGTTLNWVGGGKPVEIRLTDARLLDGKGAKLAGFGEVGVGVQGSALLRGNLVLTGITLRRTNAVLRRSADGSFELGLSDRPSGGDTEPSADATEWFDRWVAPDDADSPLAQLSKISIADSRVAVEDRLSGIEWITEKIDLTVTRKGSELAAVASLSLIVGERASDIRLDARYEQSDASVVVNVSVKDLVPAAFARQPGLELLSGFDAPVSGSARLTFADAIELTGATIDLDGRIAALSGSLRVAGDNAYSGTLTIERLTPSDLASTLPQLAELSRIRLPVRGQVEFEVRDGGMEHLEFDVTCGRGTLAIPEVYPDALAVESVRLQGSAGRDFAEIELQNATIDLGDLIATARLAVRERDGGYSADLHAAIDHATIGQVVKYWPPDAGPDAREWVAEHITAGTAGNLRLAMGMRFNPGSSSEFELESLRTDFRFSRLTIDALPPQPAITDVNGSATITADSLDFDLTGGRMNELSVESGKVSITNLSGADPSELVLDLSTVASTEAIAELLSGPPLEIVPADLLHGLEGHLNGTVQLRLPLAGRIDASSVRSSAVARVEKLVWSGGLLPEGFGITDGAADLEWKDDTIDVRGEIEVNGVTVNAGYREAFGHESPRRLEARVRVDERTLQALGVPEQPYIVPDDILEATYIGQADGSASLTATMELGHSTLAIPQTGWRKAAGGAGRASVSARRPTDGLWSIDRFELAAEDLQASGALQLAFAPLQLRRLEIEALSFSGNDLHGRLSRDPVAGYDVRIRGERFDASPLIDYLKERSRERAHDEQRTEAPDSGDGGATPIRFDVHLDELETADGTEMTGFELRGDFDGQRMHEFHLAAGMKPVAGSESAAANFELELVPDGSGHRLRIETDNLGDLVAGFHISAEFEGGTARLTATRAAPDKPFEGEILAESFTLLEAPALAKILELASIRGMTKALESGDLQFRMVSADLTMHEGVLTLARGTALGHGFGITARGTVDTRRRLFNVRGAVTPMETIQRVIGKIPLIGRLLAGWHREGIIAVAYTMKGPMNDPELDVKGYSVLTPGITREIVTFESDLDDSEKKKKRKDKKSREP